MSAGQEARFGWMICSNAETRSRFNFDSQKAERIFMKEIDFELLRKRREKILMLRAGINESQNISLGYVLNIDGKQYPVMACFPVGTNDEGAKDKFNYLINGQKS